jgi:hypothetical protein
LVLLRLLLVVVVVVVVVVVLLLLLPGQNTQFVVLGVSMNALLVGSGRQLNES